jgi:GT2 family glycosyltransferase
MSRPPETEPQISVVVPVYSGLPHLEEQVEGILAQQTARPFELILADNGSSDGSLAYAGRLARCNRHVRAVDATWRRGQAAARNIGAQSARGATLVFADQDDVCQPSWLESLVQALGDADLSGGEVRYFGARGSAAEEGSADLATAGLFRYPYAYLPFAISANLAIKRDVFWSLGGFDERLAAAADLDLCWRAQEAGYRLAFAPGAVIRKRQRGSAASAFRQHFAYALDDAVLYQLHRDHGMARQPSRTLRQWAWLVLNAPGAVGSAVVRRAWVRAAGMRVGRLYGSLRVWSWYP